MNKISDGYHTFDELYDHRNILFLTLISSNHRISWCSLLHDDSTMFDGYFIAGIDFPAYGRVTYHIPIKFWELAVKTGCLILNKGKKWDGLGPDHGLKILEEFIKFSGFLNERSGCFIRNG